MSAINKVVQILVSPKSKALKNEKLRKEKRKENIKQFLNEKW